MTPRMIFVVLSNPVEGSDEAYNDWYNNSHVPDLLRVPGVVAARRYRLADAQREPAPHPYQYLCVYEVEADNPQAVVDEIAARSGTPAMPRSELLAPGAIAPLFEAITGRIVAEPT